MDEQEYLVNYIKEQQEKGFDDDTIKQTLIKAGWDEAQIAQGFGQEAPQATQQPATETTPPPQETNAPATQPQPTSQAKTRPENNVASAKIQFSKKTIIFIVGGLAGGLLLAYLSSLIL